MSELFSFSNRLTSVSITDILHSKFIKLWCEENIILPGQHIQSELVRIEEKASKEERLSQPCDPQPITQQQPLPAPVSFEVELEPPKK